MATLYYPTGLFLVAALAACGTEPTPPADGRIAVAVFTTGGDQPTADYTVTVTGDIGVRKASFYLSGHHIWYDLARGAYQVRLAGVPDNSSITGGAVRQTEVAGPAAVQVTFAVDCFETGIAISVETEGLDPDPEYRVKLNGLDVGYLDNGAGRVSRLAPGSYRLELGDVDSNCALQAPALPIQVTAESEYGIGIRNRNFLRPPQRTGRCAGCPLGSPRRSPGARARRPGALGSGQAVGRRPAASSSDVRAREGPRARGPGLRVGVTGRAREIAMASTPTPGPLEAADCSPATAISKSCTRSGRPSAMTM